MYEPRKAYEFTFERRTLIRIIGGVAFLNVLVFAAGFMTGVSLTFPQWVQNHETKPSEIQTGFYMPPAEPIPAPQLAKPVPEAVQPVPEEILQAGEAAEEADVDPDAWDQPAVNGNMYPSKYAVQIGAFLSPDHADSLIRELKDKGYIPYIFRAPDSNGRVWHLVRIGRFTDRPTAANAAISFNMKERMTALVRPSGTM